MGLIERASCIYLRLSNSPSSIPKDTMVKGHVQSSHWRERLEAHPRSICSTTCGHMVAHKEATHRTGPEHKPAARASEHKRAAWASEH